MDNHSSITCTEQPYVHICIQVVRCEVFERLEDEVVFA